MASDSPPPFLSWQFIVMIAATLGILVNQGGTLPLSPAGAGTGAKDSADEGGLPKITNSRLWCDPYDTPKKTDIGLADSSTGTPDGSMIVGAPGLPDGGLKAIADGPICILPVIVRGESNSEEAHEMRIRFRIATVCGLGVDGLVPDDPNHLMWTRIQLCDGTQETMPAEWFLRGSLSRRQPTPYPAVLVVWVRDSVLFTSPLEQLQQIRSQLEKQLTFRSLYKVARPDFKVIGPYWSGTLVDILGAPDLKVGRGITFYSSTATMADGVLDLLAREKGVRGPVDRRLLADREAGPVLVNLTCTDEQLSESMINELKLRGVDPFDKTTRIAIISDADTDYGRVLPLTFAAKYREWMDPGILDQEDMPMLMSSAYWKIKFDDARSWPSQILRAYYVSGVEGSLKASDETDKAPSDGSKTAPGSNSSAISLQRAEGEHQIDYIARLGRIFAQRISERDLEQGRPGELRAIGILGADVYDKLLLIQALRPIFRGAIFFTDTLDARFMDPVQAIPFTRNVVISSSYGFDLFRNLQVGAPPFRSTEQTGAFLAVQAAAAMVKPRLGKLQLQLKPLRFEIGRTYPVPLVIPDAPRPPDEKADLLGTVGKFDGLLHPPEAAYLPDWGLMRTRYLIPAVSSMVFAGLLYATVLFVVRGYIPIAKWRERRTWVIVFYSTVFLLCVGAVWRFYDGIEPATWIQGVSVWPSEFIRILAFATGLVCLFVCHSKVRKSRAILSEEFRGKPPDRMESPRGGIWARLRNTITKPHQPLNEYLFTFGRAAGKFGMLEGASTTGEPPADGPQAGDGERTGQKYVIFEALWTDACERSTVFGRNVRTSAMTLLFSLALVCLLVTTGKPPEVPHRGDFGMMCDHIIVSGASLMLIYLMFWVVDETHTCLRFIQKLGRDEPTIWPQQAYDTIPSFRPKMSPGGIKGNAASPYIDVCFIGELTAEAVPLIVFPFVVLTLLIVARWNFFADWRWEPFVLAVFVIDSVVCVACAVKLRKAAVAAKEGAIMQIAMSASCARADGTPDKAKALDALRKLMEENMDGAFMPWHQQPFVSAVLLPFGGTGGLGIIEYLLSKT